MGFLGLRASQRELVVAVTIFIILIVIFIVMMIHLNNGEDFYNGLIKPTFAAPPWLFIIMLAITILVLGYGGVVTFNAKADEDQVLCFSLWVASVIVLWAAMLAFFERNLLVETSYLLILFLALHVSLTYKLQFLNKSCAAAYFAIAIWFTYLIVTLTEFIKLNK